MSLADRASKLQDKLVAHNKASDDATRDVLMQRQAHTQSLQVHTVPIHTQCLRARGHAPRASFNAAVSLPGPLIHSPTQKVAYLLQCLTHCFSASPTASVLHPLLQCFTHCFSASLTASVPHPLPRCHAHCFSASPSASLPLLQCLALCLGATPTAVGPQQTLFSLGRADLMGCRQYMIN